MEENDFRGIWRTRGGQIVEIRIKGYSAVHNQIIFMGKSKKEEPLYWHLNGNSLDNRDLDLMTKGTESYGEIKF